MGRQSLLTFILMAILLSVAACSVQDLASLNSNLNSSNGDPNFNESTYPAWRKGLPKNVFSPIPNTKNMNGTTGNRTTIDAWNGLAASSTSWYSVLNGGHADSSENRAIKIDLSADAPQWVLLNAGSAAPGAADAPYYPDGLPASRHTYYTLQFVKARNRVMTFGSSGLWGTGNGGGPQVDGFDISSNKYDPQGSFANLPFSSAISAGVAKHPVTEDIYYCSGLKWAKWTQATNTWSVLPIQTSAQWVYKPTFIDATRNRWVLITGSQMNFIDLTTLTYTGKAITGMSGTSFVGDYGAAVYDEGNDRYIIYTVDGVIYSVDPVSGAATWMANAPLVVNGAHTRLAYFKSLGGVAFLPSFNSDVLFLPTR